MTFIWFIAIAAVFIYLLYEIISNYWLVPNLTDKSVLITGCDTGFGHELALKLVRRGIATFAACLTEEGEKKLKAATVGASGKMKTVRMNITSQESVDAARAYVSQELGPDKGLWALVNNAGILGATAPCEWLSIDDWHQTIDVNCLGLIRVTHAFKSMVKRERGRVIVVTSLAGRQTLALCAPYCASKYAAEAYASGLRLEMMPFGVTVHIIEPGFMATNLTSIHATGSSLRELWMRQSKLVQNEYGEAYVQEAIDCIDRAFRIFRSNRIHAVPDACAHAITSKLAKRRYVVGFDANLFLSVQWLPTAIKDYLMLLFFYIIGYPKPSPALIRANESG